MQLRGGRVNHYGIEAVFANIALAGRCGDQPCAGAVHQTFEHGHLAVWKATMGKLKVDQSSLSWMNNEVTHLESMIEEVAGPLAADGGYLAEDIYGNLPQTSWQKLTRIFLHT